MKKLLTVLLAALMVFALVGCGKKEETPTDGGATPAEDDGVTKVAVLIPHRGDQSYFDTIAGAADEMNALPEYTVDVFECDPSGEKAEANWMNWFDNVCEDHQYDLVVCGNGDYEDFLYKACEKYPDQLFFNYDYDYVPESGIPANCYSTKCNTAELGYLVGSLSAAITKTGTVGVVVGMDTQSMNQFISGYCQVLADNDVKYVVSYPGSFSDTALGKEVTTDMINKGADVIWQVAGGLGNGVIDACSEHEDVWCIGVDQDQYNQFKDTNPEWANTILTSALKNTGVPLKAFIEMVANGNYADKLGKAEMWGIALNGVGLAENDFYMAHTDEATRAKLAEVLASVVNGEVKVIDCLTDWNADEYAANWPTLLESNRVQ